MDVKQAAIGLLILRIISSVALGWVIYKQVKYVRINQPPEEQRIRYGLLSLTVILMAGNIIPILVDVLTIVSDLGRSTNRINAVGIAYTFNNASFAAVAGIAWGLFYILAEKLQVHLKQENKELHNENDQLHEDADKKTRRPKNS
jgi:hypothetical protein